MALCFLKRSLWNPVQLFVRIVRIYISNNLLMCVFGRTEKVYALCTLCVFYRLTNISLIVILLGCIECTRRGLLLPMCAASVSQSVCHAAQLGFTVRESFGAAFADSIEQKHTNSEKSRQELKNENFQRLREACTLIWHRWHRMCQERNYLNAFVEAMKDC